MADNDTTFGLPQEVLSKLPQSDLCQTALSLACKSVSRPIFNHCVRVFLAAHWLAQKEDSEWAQPDKLPLLFVACVCHDLGTCDDFNGPQRFEVEGADAAERHCQSHGISDADSHRVWTAIAIHTSTGIAERIDPLSRLVRFGVMMDFSPPTRQQVGGDELFAEIEKTLPRLDIERVLAEAVVGQAGEAETSQRVDNKTWFSTHKFPVASWPGILLRARLQNPDHVGRNPAF
jgi:hypothetical protein